MAITRWSYRNPWQELDTLSNRLQTVFGDGSNGRTGADWAPAVNVEETSEALYLTAELPGMTTEDLELEIENSVLTLRGEKSETRREDGKYHVWERHAGSFQRSFTLPRTVQADKIEAEFRDGILHVTMPKAPEAKGRRISIAASAS